MGKLYTTDDITVDGNGIINNAEITTARVTESTFLDGPLLKKDITASNVNLTTIQEISTAESFPETLLPYTTYVVRGTLFVTNSIIVSNPGCSIVGLDNKRDMLLFAGKGNFITVKNQSFTLDNLAIRGGKNNYEFFIQGDNITREGPAPVPDGDPYLRNEIVSVTNCLFSQINASTIFSLRGFGLVVFRGNVFQSIYSQVAGLLFKDTLKLIIDSCSLSNFANGRNPSIGSLISLAKYESRFDEFPPPGFGDVMISNCIVTPMVGLVGLSIDSTVPTVSGSIIGNNFYGRLREGEEGRSTNIENFNEGSLVSYTSSGNTSLVDGTPYCAITLEGGDSVGSLILTPLQAFGFVADEVQKFDFNTDRSQFFNLSLNSSVLNSQKVFISANFSISLLIVTGNREDYADFYIAKNQNIITASMVRVPLLYQTIANFNLTAMTSLNTQETIEIFYRTSFASEREEQGMYLINGNINVMSI